MLPGNVDPRRPDKVQRYKPSSVSTNGQGEDLTPDYMNILGHQTQNENCDSTDNSSSVVGSSSGDHPQTSRMINEEPHVEGSSAVPATSSATSVIPTSPQYGVAIIGSEELPLAQNITSSPSIIESVPDKPPDDSKEAPSRNDRFKVVKIASLEPFKRGRWKCMDYVDEVPNVQPKMNNSMQVNTGGVAGGATVYMQTQSLPQQQIQQILMQGGYSNGSQYFQNVPQQQQMVPQTQYFYASQGGSVPQTQFINSQQYFAANPPNLVPNSANYTAINPNFNVQYVPIQANSSATFVPNQLNFQQQQSQTFGGIINGHFNEQQQQQQQQSHQPQQGGQANVSINLPTQNAKNVILSNQGQQQQQQVAPIGTVPMQQNQQQFATNNANIQQVVLQNFENASNVYTNPQFASSVNSLLLEAANANPNVNVVIETNSSSETLENTAVAASSSTTVVASSETNVANVELSSDDPAKTNPVVNAIDNKIEQAMDLVKSHLMYTVREEVEVLKEKIAELMERIQQLETENNYLRSQIPKNQVLNMPIAPIASSSSNNVNNAISSTATANSNVNVNVIAGQAPNTKTTTISSATTNNSGSLVGVLTTQNINNATTSTIATTTTTTTTTTTITNPETVQ